MNKKEREQLLRDTLDQCLSGLDTLPSDRAEVNRRLTETMPEAKRRIRLRRFTVPAVALVLCVCLIITGTHLGMIPWPDRIRPQETKVTAAPVALSQPTGEGTGTPGAPTREAAPDPDAAAAEKYLREFFSAWHSGDVSGMYGFAGIGLFDPDYFAAMNTFDILKTTLTPGDPEIKSISGSEGDPVRTAEVICRMTDSSSSSGLYRFMIDMPRREDGLRCLDFRSLQSFDQLADDRQSVILSVTWPYVIAGSVPMGLAGNLIPLHLVSEKEGLRFEVIAAAATSDKAMLIWSLQGSEENWDDPFSTGIPPQVLWSGLDNYGTPKSTAYYYDRSTKTCTVAELVWFRTPLKGENGTVTVSLDPVPVVSWETIDLLPYYTQYGSGAQAVDTPFSLSMDTHRNSDQYSRDIPHVLDYSHPLDIRLSDHILLSGIGDVDGRLHVQFHYADNEILYPASSGGSITSRKSLTRINGNHVLPNPFRWSGNGVEFFKNGFIEYVLQPIEEGSGIPLTISTTSGYITGGWSVEVPLSSIRIAESEIVEAASKPAVTEQTARQEIENRFAEFFLAWNADDLNAMLELCSPAWMSAQANPRQALFMILQNRTPSLGAIESISGTSGDSVRIVDTLVSMNYNNSEPDTTLRMNVRMVLEDSSWYVDPESLLSWKVTSETLPSPEPVSASEEDPMDVLRRLCPDCPADFVPVGLSCEKEGFRLELNSASVKEQSAFFIFSLQDLAGDRLSYATDPFVYLAGECPNIYNYNLSYDEASRKLTFAVKYEYDSPDVFLDGTQQVTAVLPALYVEKGNRLSIGGLLEKYGDRASLVDVPQLIPITYDDPDGTSRDYGTSWYRDQGIKVLDYTRPLSVRLHKNLELSGIGLIDGQLHVQLHYVDNMVSGPDGSERYKPIPAAYVDSPCEPFPAPVHAMRWDTDGDGQEDFTEYVYSCKTEAEAAKDLTVSFREILDCIEGPWTIEVPLETVWTGDPGAPETEVPEAETAPEPELTPEPESNPELNLITRLQGSILDCLTDVVPVGLTCEQEGFRLELVSASVKETAATFIFAMQDLEGDRLSSGVLPYVDMPNEDSGRYGRNLRTSLIYDHSSRKAFFAADARYDSPEILLNSAQQISLSVADLLIDRTTTLPLGDYLSQYGDRAALVDLPDLLPGHDVGPDGEGRVWTTDDYRKLGWKVLDYTHPLSVRLHEHLELSGIGVVGGQLHVQLHYLDNQAVRMGRYTTTPISYLFVWRPRESDSPSPRMEWDTDGDGAADFVEFVYPCESEADIADDLEVVFEETLDFVEGHWTIDVPLETVWTGDPDAIKTEAPDDADETVSRAAEFFRAWGDNQISLLVEYCSPAWVSAQADPKPALFSILMNRTPSSFTVESVSGSSGDAVRDVITTVSMFYNNNKPETLIRLNIRMVREDNAWYVDPESLVSYRIIETPAPEQ